MGKNKKLVIIMLAFVLFVGGAFVLYNFLGDEMIVDPFMTEESTEESSGDSNSNSDGKNYPEAYDFTVYDEDGNEVQLWDYIGKPIVLNFWASWCGPCKMEMPEFNEKYLEVGDEVQFLMVNMTNNYRESLGAAKAYLNSKPFTFTVLYDIDGDAEKTYGITSSPTTYFINAKGQLVAKAVGAIDKEQLQQGINMIR